MKLLRFFLLSVLAFNTYLLEAQEGYFQLKDSESNESIPFAHLVFTPSGIHATTNENGFFSANLIQPSDSVWISAIGYGKQKAELPKAPNSVILIPPTTIQLPTAFIKPQETDLLRQLKKAIHNHQEKEFGKTHLQLFSYRNGNRVEGFEGYYNYHIKGINYESLDIKAGNIALKDDQGHFFLSTATSKVVSKYNAQSKKTPFPLIPIQLPNQKAVERFIIWHGAESIWNGDAIYEIKWEPEPLYSTSCMAGSAWINRRTKRLVKLEVKSVFTEKHPFVGIADTKVKNKKIEAAFFIVKEWNTHATFSNLDFNYQLRISHGNDTTIVSTTTHLCNYDAGNPFWPHNLVISKDAMYADYLATFALGYNSDFWKHNGVENEHRKWISAHHNIQRPILALQKDQLFEGPYPHWSDTIRFFIKPQLEKPLKHTSQAKTDIQKFGLSPFIFVDPFVSSDTTYIRTVCILDPYKSTYTLPEDSLTHCITNMYFDLCEIQRRKLEKELHQNPISSKEDLQKRVQLHQKEMEQQQYNFLSESNLGKDTKSFEKWNQTIKEKLGIDNMQLFNIPKSTDGFMRTKHNFKEKN